MVTEDYCSQEIYRLLKEKGFNGELHTIFDEDGYTIPVVYHQMAMKWLREKHNLFIQITIDFSDGACPMYDSTAINLATCEKTIITGYNRYSYKEAITTTLKYSLENLI